MYSTGPGIGAQFRAAESLETGGEWAFSLTSLPSLD